MVRLVIGRFATTAKIMFLKPYQLALCDRLPDTDQNQQDSGRGVKHAKNALYRCASLLNEFDEKQCSRYVTGQSSPAFIPDIKTHEDNEYAR